MPTTPTSRELLELLADGYDAVTTWCLSSGTAVRRVRRLLRSQLARHITDRAVLADLDVIVSELATNACLHVGGACEIRVMYHHGAPVICEVADAGGGLDRVAAHLGRSAGRDAVAGVEALAESGRGLRIVAGLSEGRCGVRTTWLWSTGQLGKGVWFTIPVDRADGRAPASEPWAVGLARGLAERRGGVPAPPAGMDLLDGRRTARCAK